MKKKLIPTLSSNELTTISRTQDCAPHHHINCEFLFIVQGTIINTVNDMSTIAEPGTIFFLNNQVSHELKQTEANYEHRDIYLSQPLLQKICHDYFDDEFYQYLMSTDKIIKIHANADLFDSFEKRLKKNQSLYALFREKREIVKKSNLNIIISLLGLLYEQLPSYPSPQQNWLNSFLEKIQSPKIFTMPIQDIIKLSNYSTSYFSHQFSKTFNIPFKVYITNLKIDYAKLLLRSHSLTLTEISYICGFSTQSYFTQTFKQSTGITPHKYRKLHSDEN